LVRTGWHLPVAGFPPVRPATPARPPAECSRPAALFAAKGVSRHDLSGTAGHKPRRDTGEFRRNGLAAFSLRRCGDMMRNAQGWLWSIPAAGGTSATQTEQTK
jgi:hypothetical protein